MKSIILKLLIILLTLTLYSCEKEECDGDPVEFPSPFGFVLHDINGKDLVYDLGVNPEEKASLLDENENLVMINIERRTQRLTGYISFKYIDRLEIPNGKTTKTFYLRLPDDLGNPNSDIDTLRFVYELTYQEGCIPIVFKSFEVSYNDSIYTDDKLSQSATFIKK